MKPGCNLPILTISCPYWHPLAFPFRTLPVLLVMVVVLLSIHKSFLKIKSFHARNFPSPVSFELMTSKLTSGNKETIFLNIYRPPSSKISTVFDEFQNLFEFFVPLPSELIIIGDFNIHTDSDLTTPNKFSCILDNFHLKQHIHFPTHDDGHTLDLLITRTSSDIITYLSHHESYQSDHKSFKFFSHIRPTTQRTVIQYRSFKTIDIDNFKSDIVSSPLYTNPASNSSDLIYLNSSPRPSIPYSTSMPHSNQKLLSLDPIHYGLIPKFLWPNGREVDSNNHDIIGNLPLTARNLEPIAILSNL